MIFNLLPINFLTVSMPYHHIDAMQFKLGAAHRFLLQKHELNVILYS
jgi:hypothetical protein